MKNCRRRRSNSELKLIAETLGSPVHGGMYKDESSDDDDDNTQATAPARSSFQLLQCSDEMCEVFTPANRSIRTQHRARNNVQFMWDEPPTTVLFIKKPNDPAVTDMLVKMATWLVHERRLRVYLEPSVVAEVPPLAGTHTWTDERDWHHVQRSIDFVVSLGGDGTVLWVSSLFHKSVPPVISFAMGSLGFLTPFDCDGHKGTTHLMLPMAVGVWLAYRTCSAQTI